MRIVIVEDVERTRNERGASLELAATVRGEVLDLDLPTSLGDALVLLRLSPPDVVLCHPGSGDWLENLRRTIEASGASPVVVISSASDALRLEARRLGVAGWCEAGSEAGEVLLRLSGAAEYARSRPEREVRALRQLARVMERAIVVLERVEATLDGNPDAELEKRTPFRDWATSVLDRGVIRAIIVLLASLITLIGAALGIESYKVPEVIDAPTEAAP